MVGAVGFELHGVEGVLRSLAVDEARRGAGIGAMLTEVVLEHARVCGVERVFLLTTTAEQYFARRGFRKTTREEASPGVRSSIEFREACPASATAMMLDLRRG